MRRHRPGVALALVGLLALGSAGCGGSHSRATTRASGPCSPDARAVVAGAAGTPAALVTGQSLTVPSGASGCRFAAPGPLRVLATIDTAPQASARFERGVVEYGQNVVWSHRGPSPYPQDIAGLGQGADWFPADRRLLATAGARLIEITVTWPGGTPAAERRLALALARGYLAAA